MVYMLKSPIIAWAACGTAQWQYATSTFPITHLIRPPTPPPPKICITFVFHFSWVLQPSQVKLKTILMQTFFLEGVRGGANKVHYGKFGSVESEKTLGKGLAYMLILR